MEERREGGGRTGAHFAPPIRLPYGISIRPRLRRPGGEGPRCCQPAATSLRCCPAALLPHCTVASLRRCAVAPLRCCLTALLPRRPVAPLQCCLTALLPRCAVASLLCCPAALLRHCSGVPPPCCLTARCCPTALLPLCYVAPLLCCPTAFVLGRGLDGQCGSAWPAEAAAPVGVDRDTCRVPFVRPQHRPAGGHTGGWIPAQVMVRRPEQEFAWNVSTG